MKHRQKRKTGRRHGHPTGPPLTCGEQAKGQTAQLWKEVLLNDPNNVLPTVGVDRDG